MRKKLAVDVKGMHCASCSSRIERVLSEMEGVVTASVNLAAETLTVDFNDDDIKLSDISKKVEGLGFELIKPIEKEENEIHLKISGMHCASCSSRIEKVIEKLTGVLSVSVNLADETGRFVIDIEKTTLRNIRETIHGLGFGTEWVTDTAHHFEKRQQEIAKNLKEMKQRLIWEFILVIPLLTVSMGEMIGLQLPQVISSQSSPFNFAVIQFIFTLPIMWFGKHFYFDGIPALLRRSPNMDSLIAVGTGAAFIYSLWSLVEIASGVDPVLRAKDLYFESVGVLITLVSLGKYMENVSKSRTSDAIRQLVQLTPKMAILLDEDDERQISIDEVEADDILLVKPGERVPVDGKIVKGESFIDESMMTGESMPVLKKIGDTLYGGTVNNRNTLQLQALQTGENTMLARIIRMVQEAQGSKAAIARTADRVSYYFVPIVMCIAVLTGIAWYLLSDVGFSQSLRFFIAVMVIACPCAMGLATPISIMVGTGRGAQLGVLVRNGETFEKTENITTIVFDKTGTITKGVPKVTDFLNLSKKLSDQEVFYLIGSAEKSSEHPLAEAVVKYVEEAGVNMKLPEFFTPVQGRGIEAKIDGNTVVIGNRGFLESHAISCSNYKKDYQHLSQQGKTVLFYAINGERSGLFAIADEMKKEVPAVISSLKRKGLKVVMLTGDNWKTAEVIAELAGIDEIVAEVMPDKKAEIIKALQENGRIVAMIGDGINDAPALAQADVGIAMGTGIDIAIEAGEVVIMNGHLDGVETIFGLSRAVMRNIRQNLFWAFGYNIVGIPIAAGLLFIFGGPTLNPMIAGAAMAMSSVSVVGNALRLRYFDR